MFEDEYSKRFPSCTTNKVTSTLHNIDNSIAFLKRPLLLLLNVDCLARTLVIGLILILFRPTAKRLVSLSGPLDVRMNSLAMCLAGRCSVMCMCES